MKNMVSLFLIIMLSYNCNKAEKKTSDRRAEKSWIKNKNNPVLVREKGYSYDLYAISDCWVIYHEEKYKMWYTSGGVVLPDTVFHNSISYATSTDGVKWTKYKQNPVMDVGKTSWDSLGVETVTVIIDSAAANPERYKMWYAGQTFNDHRYEFGYAYSPDGISWKKHLGQVLSVGNNKSWDNCFIEGPSVLKEGHTYKMWYAGYDCEVNGQETDGKVNIGYATSTDGINWTKYKGNPVLKTSKGEWDEVYVQDPHVVKYRGYYHMWFGGVNKGDNYGQETGYAYSTDGINWTKSPHNPVLRRGKKGEWDANTASFASALIKDNKIKMWYSGKDVEPLPAWPKSYFWDLGFAEKILPDSILLD